ncbi:MAG TPA: hypothetical protein VNG13_11000 [Mycobacteriales bacterium]|nr:hypothetical protein [Mycobacteriales bacterium]
MQPGEQVAAPADHGGGSILFRGAGVAVGFGLGVLLGLIGAFLVPSGLTGISIAIALVGNLLAGRLASLSTGSRLGAFAPALGWFLVLVWGMVHGPGGSLVLAYPVGDGNLLGVAWGFMLGGAVGALLPILWGGRPIRRPDRVRIAAPAQVNPPPGP